ncbi:MAG TPA: hypothetical protein DCE65_02195 [Clostridiales bacterium]|nr:hypothetical protein [Clostridiales bacterium]
MLSVFTKPRSIILCSFTKRKRFTRISLKNAEKKKRNEIYLKALRRRIKTLTAKKKTDIIYRKVYGVILSRTFYAAMRHRRLR